MSKKYWLALTLGGFLALTPISAGAEEAGRALSFDAGGDLSVSAAQTAETEQQRRYIRSGVTGLERQAQEKRLNKSAEEAMRAALSLEPLKESDTVLSGAAREEAKRQPAMAKPEAGNAAAPSPALKLAAAPSAGSVHFEPLNRVWLKGFGNWSSQKRRDGQSGYEFDQSGLMLGYDHQIAAVPGLVLGVSGSLASGDLKSKEGGEKADIDFRTLAVYGRYNLENGLFARVNLGLGQTDNHSKYIDAAGNRRKGNFDSEAYQMGFSFGYIYQDPIGFRVIPSVGVQYFHLRQKGWNSGLAASDSGYARLGNWYRIDRDNQIQIPVRLKADMPVELEGGIVLTPEIRLGLIVDTHKPHTIMRMDFYDSGYDGQMAYALEPGRNRFQIGTGVKAQINEMFDLFLDYQLDFRQKYQNHNASGGLGISF